MNDYLTGCDVLAACHDESVVGAPQDAGPFVTIHVRDVAGLVKAKSGATGSIFEKILPKTIEGKVYGDIRDKIAAGMKSEGVDADVKVVSTVSGEPLGSDFLIGTALGAALLGVGLGVFKLVFRRKR